MKNPLVRIPVIVIVVAIIASVAWSKYSPSRTDMTALPLTPVASEIPSLPAAKVCYYRSTKTNKGNYDKAYLIMTINGSTVTGEFHNLPAEKVQAIGTFTGSIDQKNKSALSKIATVWWNQLAGGSQSVNELLIVYNDSQASVGFGEMTKQDETTYVYKDKANLTYTSPMPMYNCDTLSEITTVEQYIKDNIKTMTVFTDPAPVGGTWYITQSTVDPVTHTAEISYEDGHVAHKAKIEYTYDPSTKTTVITTFTKI
jgi:hypothetical protein